MRSAKVSVTPLPMRRPWPRSQPRRLLISLVRAETTASCIPQMLFHSRDRALGMCTEGRSIRQETSLSALASRRSVFVLRAPTPRLRTSVAGTTLTSCPALFAASAMRNASAAVSRITRDHSRLRHLPQEVRQRGSIQAPLEQYPSVRGTHAHLGFPSTQIDRTMVHGWFLSLAPRARKCLGDGKR